MADGDEEEVQEEAPPVIVDPVDLTEDLMDLSQVGKTIDGLGFAFFQLDCAGKQIGDINLLDHYEHLRQIDLSNNLIKDVQPLARLGRVLKLNLAKNGIQSMEPLLGLRHLLYMDVSGNDLTALSELPMPSLKQANFSHNKISTCSGFKGHSALQSLDLSYNELEAFDGIKNMPELKTLVLGHNRASSVQGLQEVGSLEVLDLSANAFESLLEPVELLNSVTALDLSQNKITNASKLQNIEGLYNLKKLVANQNPLDEEEGVNVRLEAILFQKSLAEINGEPVTADERGDAQALREKRLEEEAERRRQEEEARLAEEEARRQAEEEERLAREAAEAERAAAEEEEARRRAEEEEARRQAEEEGEEGDADGEEGGGTDE